jgi:hypothetical protein
VQLLNRTLGEMVHEFLAFWRHKWYLFFKLGRGRQTRRFSYRSFEKQASRDVVKTYTRQGDTKPSYYRPTSLQTGITNSATRPIG